MSGLSTLGGLDPGIERAVNLLREARVETFESCEGGAGHAFPEPTIRFGLQLTRFNSGVLWSAWIPV